MSQSPEKKEMVIRDKKDLDEILKRFFLAPDEVPVKRSTRKEKKRDDKKTVSLRDQGCAHGPFDVIPFISGRSGCESPRGPRRHHGLSAFLDGDSCDGKIDVLTSRAATDIAEEAGSSISSDSSSHSRLPFYVPEVKTNVFRREARTDIGKAAGYLGLEQRTNDNARLTTVTAIDPPSYSLTNARFRGGERLVEVFSVRINYSSFSENRGDVYGAIRVGHNIGDSYLYNRQPSDSKSISLYDDTLSLIGPSYVIYFCDYFEVKLDLKDRDGDLFPCDDDGLEQSLTLYSRQVRYKPESFFGKPMSYEFHGNFGSATVYYTIFKSAVEASVKVEVVKGDQVYGSVVARYSDYDYSAGDHMKYYQSVLFQKTRNDNVKVKLWKVIPLSRSVVAVPVSSSLVIAANLWNNNTNQLNHDDQIANGIAVFTPQATGQIVREIKGDNGFARVTVEWSTVDDYFFARS